MSTTVPGPKFRNRWITLFFFVVPLIAGYVVWTRVSALQVLRRFVKEMDIPVQVRSANWDMRIRELLTGTIRDLHLEIYYEPLKADFTIDTPVAYVHEDKQWTIHLKPTMRINALPPAQGNVDLDLATRRAKVTFDLHEARPLKFANAQGSIEAKSWRIKGNLAWDHRWNAEADVQLTDVTIQNGHEPQSIATKSIQISNTVTWPDKPPLPLAVNSKITIGPVDVLFGKMFFEESTVAAKTTFQYDGHDFNNVDISVDKPAQVHVTGQYGQKPAHADLNFKGDLNALVTQRLGQWIGPLVPPLRGAKAEGKIDLQAHLNGNRATGKVRVDAKHVELPASGLSVDNVKFEAPLSFPDDPEWGRFEVAAARYQSVRLYNVAAFAKLSTDGLDVTTEGDNDVDQPIRQSVWGGAIEIEHLFAHIGGKEGLAVALAVRGGPFQIAQIQKDLCILPKQPIAGTVQFNYPQFVHDKDAIHLIGNTDFVVFNGTAHVGDLHLFTNEHDPHLLLNITWNDLDMHAIGDFTHFGDMRGSIGGSLQDTEIAITKIGLIPLSYQFTLHGTPRSGKEISFYGRAVDNILALLGNQKNELPWYAKFALSISTTFRNWSPVKAQCLGFKAKSSNNWTELSTYDAECCTQADYDAKEPDCPLDKKNHYILRGSGFKIPLNTHGVYPVVMRTSAFQEWLNTMAKYFEEISGNGKKSDECTTPW